MIRLSRLQYGIIQLYNLRIFCYMGIVLSNSTHTCTVGIWLHFGFLELIERFWRGLLTGLLDDGADGRALNQSSHISEILRQKSRDNVCQRNFRKRVF